jgi:phosphoglycolate phosphatase-like HAD superfamily hydrolase
MTRLAVFDIDGTLCDTNAVDDACFVQAVSELIAVEPAQIDWSDAPHITDSGLLDWLCAKHRSRPPESSEVESVLGRFLELLQERVASCPHLFRAIPGAPEALAFLAQTGWDVALATGGWRLCAQLKLAHIGLAPDAYILATADDAKTRAGIVRLAVAKAQAESGQHYTRVVSIGDAPWDVTTAVELALPFVGVASDDRASRLRHAGAGIVLPDMLDRSALYDALHNASVPGTSSRLVFLPSRGR